jgi:hypothetical protein
MTHLRTGVYASPAASARVRGSIAVGFVHRPAYSASLVASEDRTSCDASDASDAVYAAGCTMASAPVRR